MIALVLLAQTSATTPAAQGGTAASWIPLLVVLLPIAGMLLRWLWVRAILWLRDHGHADAAKTMEALTPLEKALIEAITKGDHTGSVAGTLEGIAERHGVEEHPAVAKLTS